MRAATSAKNTTHHALETASQTILDTTLMWCAGWIEPPLYTFVSELNCNDDSVPIWRSSFSTSMILVPFSDQILAERPLSDTNHSILLAQEVVSMDVTISARVITWTARVLTQCKGIPPFY